MHTAARSCSNSLMEDTTRYSCIPQNELDTRYEDERLLGELRVADGNRIIFIRIPQTAVARTSVVW